MRWWGHPPTGSVQGPILVDFDCGKYGGEPDGSLTLGPPSASQTQSGGGSSRFVG